MTGFTEPADSAAQLRVATVAERAMRRQGRWCVRYLLAFGGWQLLFVPAVLLGRSATVVATAICANTLLVVSLGWYAARQPMARRGFARTCDLVAGIWGALYGLTIALGFTAFKDSAAFAVVATVACALPPVIAGLREARTAR
jgi:hypothetical protein